MPHRARNWGPTQFVGVGIRVLFAGLVLASFARGSLAQPAVKPADKPAADAKSPAAPPLVSPGVDPSTFLTLPYDESLKKNYTAVFKVLTAGKVTPDQEQLFDTYYMRYSLGRWTVPANFTLLPKFRDELRRDLYKTKVGDAHQRIVDIIFKGMSRVATGNYHPVVRVNAMLAIGDLNSDDSNRDTPLPYAPVVPVLLQVIDDPQQLDAVKAAAFVGLMRHARLGFKENVRASVGTSMLALAKSTGAPGRSPDGHAWLRSEAVEILGLLGNIGDANVVADALGQIVGDPATPMMVRRAGAAALGKLNYQIAVTLNGSTLVSALGRFTIAAIEKAQSDSEQGKPTPGRRLKTYVIAAAEGSNGLANSLKDPTQKQAAVAVRDAIAKLNKVCDRGSESDILQQASSTAAELRRLVEKKP
jgi:hypothetical protein